MNDFYAKETSKNIKKTKNRKRKNDGFYYISQAPFGYKKIDVKGNIEIVEEQANLIRRIYKEFKEGKWSPKIRNEVALAIHGSGSDRHSFINLLKGRGIDVVFRENEENRIYGVTFIDHNSKEVYNGSRLGKEFSANVFNRLFNEPSDEPRLHNEADGSNLQRDSLSGGTSQVSETMESAIEQAFGIFSFDQHGDDYEEEAFTRRMKKKKKKGRSRGIS